MNLVRRHLDAKSRAAVAVKLRAAGKSYREIGEKLGIAPSTAQADVESSPVRNRTPEPRAEIPHVTGRDGKSYPATVTP